MNNDIRKPYQKKRRDRIKDFNNHLNMKEMFHKQKCHGKKSDEWCSFQIS